MMATTTLGTQTGVQRALACGEVGLLGEEGAQRLLSVFSEFASLCLRQIHDMSCAHGQDKFQALYKVGLDLVARWDGDVLHEETVRMETSYPEVSALHSFVYLWLLDQCFPARDLITLAVPPLPEAYAIFMRRVAQHADVAKGRVFMDNPEVFRRTVFIDAFRGAYHDLVQRRVRAARAATPGLVVRFVPSDAAFDAAVAPEDAASEVAARLVAREQLSNSFAVQGPEPPAAKSPASSALPAVESPAGSALQAAMARETGAAEKPGPARERFPPSMHLSTSWVHGGDKTIQGPADAEAGSALAPPSSTSAATRTVPVTGPCFFAVPSECGGESSAGRACA